jgi:hypothetical protein
VLFDMLVAVLATWRITSIISQESIFEPLRRRLGEKELENGLVKSTTWVSELVGCFWCLSVWVGAACTVIVLTYPILLYPFFFSAGGIFIQTWQEQIQ